MWGLEWVQGLGQEWDSLSNQQLDGGSQCDLVPVFAVEWGQEWGKMWGLELDLVWDQGLEFQYWKDLRLS